MSETFVFFCYSSYTEEGFLHLQKIVGEAIVEWKARQKLEDIAISVRHIPFPEYTTSDEFLSTSFTLIPFFIVLGFLYPVAIFTKVSLRTSNLIWPMIVHCRNHCHCIAKHCSTQHPIEVT